MNPLPSYFLLPVVFLPEVFLERIERINDVALVLFEKLAAVVAVGICVRHAMLAELEGKPNIGSVFCPDVFSFHSIAVYGELGVRIRGLQFCLDLFSLFRGFEIAHRNPEVIVDPFGFARDNMNHLHDRFLLYCLVTPIIYAYFSMYYHLCNFLPQRCYNRHIDKSEALLPYGIIGLSFT